MAACWAPSSSSSWPWESSLSDPASGILQPLMNYKHQLQQDSQQQQQQQQQNSGCDPMGLRLGKRTYFEDSAPPPAATPRSCPAAPAPDNSSPVPVSRLVSAPAAARKKQRGPAQPPATPSCQVEGCSADLSGSKGYHRRHRVCEIHSKTPKNIVAGIEQRFCQQCSRFHVLGEFDEGKRSCRRRLAGHNERRRKPPPSEAFALHHPALLGGASPIFQAELLAHQQHLLDGTFIVSPNGKSSWPDSTALLRAPAIHHLEPHHHHHQQQQQPQQGGSGQSVVGVLHPGGLQGNGFFQIKGINRDSVSSQGVYQFLKCNAVATAVGSSPTSCSSPPNHGVLPIEPGIVSSAGALSLLSAEPWSSSSSSPPAPPPTAASSNNIFVSQQPASPDPSKIDPPLFHLQLQHDGYHQQRNHQDHHHHQQQQLQHQKFGLNEFLQYQKPLEASLVFDHV